MVQEYQSPVRVYKHPFELIMAVSSVVVLNDPYKVSVILYDIRQQWI